MSVEISTPAGKGGHILVVDGAMDPEFVRRAHDELFTAVMDDGAAGRTMAGLDPTMKNSMDLPVHPGHWVQDHLHGGIAAALAIYRETWSELDHLTHLHDTGFIAQLSHPFIGYYRPHVDASPAHDWQRILAPIIYLNDVEEGGETHFIDHGVSVKPKAGRILIFPACWTHPHTGRIPLSGSKLILTTFISIGNDPVDMVEFYEGSISDMRKRMQKEIAEIETPFPPPLKEDRRIA